MSTIDEQITDVTNKIKKVDNIRLRALDLSSKIDPVVDAFQETGNYLYGVRLVGKPYDGEYLIDTASTLNSYKAELDRLANDCLVEGNKLEKRKKDLEAEKKRKEEEAAAAQAAASIAAGSSTNNSGNKSSSSSNKSSSNVNRSKIKNYVVNSNMY